MLHLRFHIRLRRPHIQAALLCLGAAAIAGCGHRGASSFLPQTTPQSTFESSPSTSVVPFGADANASTVDGTPTHGYFMFDAAYNDVVKTLTLTATSATRLGIGITWNDPVLAARVGPDHTYTLGPSIAAVTAEAQQSGAETIIYDFEKWTSTPKSEQDNPPAAVLKAAAEVCGAKPCRLTCDQWNYFLHKTSGSVPPSVNTGCLIGNDGVSEVSFDHWFDWLQGEH